MTHTLNHSLAHHTCDICAIRHAVNVPMLCARVRACVSVREGGGGWRGAEVAAYHAFTTVMREVVRVPVLSEQMVVAPPMVSHALRWRTKFWSCVPRHHVSARTCVLCVSYIRMCV